MSRQCGAHQYIGTSYEPYVWFLPLKPSSFTHYYEAIYQGDEVTEFIPEWFINTIDYWWPCHACEESLSLLVNL